MSAVCMLTPELIARLGVVYPECLYVENVAAMLGVERRTFTRWVRTGNKERAQRQRLKPQDRKLDLYVELVEALDGAMAAFQGGQLKLISAAAGDNWVAAAWLLERRWPEKWSRDTQRFAAQERRIKELESLVAELTERLVGVIGLDGGRRPRPAQPPAPETADLCPADDDHPYTEDESYHEGTD